LCRRQKQKDSSMSAHRCKIFTDCLHSVRAHGQTCGQGASAAHRKEPLGNGRSNRFHC
jgi:hypothetical protein